MISSFATNVIHAQYEASDIYQDKYLLSNNIRIHYLRAENPGKPVIIFSHGHSDCAICWLGLTNELTKDFDIIIYDARGHGLSDAPEAGYSNEDRGKDLLGLIKVLNIKNPILMGHSMGAGTTAWFAANYPNIPKAIVLEDPWIGDPDKFKEQITKQPMSPELKESLKQKREEALERNNMTLPDLAQFCIDKAHKGWLISDCQQWAVAKKYYHLNNIQNGGIIPDLDLLFSKITCPVLILKAACDEELKNKNISFANKINNVQIFHIEGAGHNVRRDKKDETLKVFNEWLKDYR